MISNTAGSTESNILIPSIKVWTFRNYLTVGGIVIFILFWTVILWMYEPAEVVGFIGVQNVYILTFIIVVIGALTSITPVSIYPMIITMALAQLNPLLLALVAGAGLALGDAIFYFLGREVKPIISRKVMKKLNKFMKWIDSKPRWMSLIIIYFYIGFTPLPNNLLTGSLAVAGFPFRKIFLPLFLGDLTLPLIFVLLAYHGINLF